MESKLYLTIAVLSILAFALIAAIPTLSTSELLHEGLMEKYQGGNMIQDQGEENGGMTEGKLILMVKEMLI